jgi:hypothetical protein
MKASFLNDGYSFWLCRIEFCIVWALKHDILFTSFCFIDIFMKLYRKSTWNLKMTWNHPKTGFLGKKYSFPWKRNDFSIKQTYFEPIWLAGSSATAFWKYCIYAAPIITMGLIQVRYRESGTVEYRSDFEFSWKN